MSISPDPPHLMLAQHQTAQTLMQMVNGFWVSQMIGVAARLRIADLVADEPKSAAELAETTGTHALSLYRLLRSLASVGVFAEDEQGRFRLTPLAEGLRMDVPGSLRDWTIFFTSEYVWRPWGNLLYSVTTGETAFSQIYGTSNWEYRTHHPAANAVFNAAMTAMAAVRTAAVLAAYDFSGIDTLVDVGGGQGATIAAILRTNPTMQGVLFDLPHVVSGAGPLLESAGVAERCKIVGGDFFEAVPSGGDAYLLTKVIHDWDDTQATAILSSCRRAIRADGKLLVVDAVVPAGNNPHPGKLSDMNMLVINAGGRERTEAEFEALLKAAGFRLTRIVSTRGESSVIEGAPM